MTKLINLVQRRVVNLAIGPSVLRNQGAPDVIEKAREYLANLDLRRFSNLTAEAFSQTLEACTDELMSSFPDGARHWGTARKALNVFLEEAFYNRFLCEEYGLHALEACLEIPMDSQVAQGLRRRAARGSLPHWYGITGLSKKARDAFQSYAQRLAASMGQARVYLDLILWRAEDTDEKID